VDEVVQVDAHTACLRVRVEAAAGAAAAGVYEGDAAAVTTDAVDAAAPLDTLWIWLCWHPVGARVTVGPSPPRGGPAEAYGFGRSLQAALGGAVLTQVRCPVAYERCVELLFAGSASAPVDTALVLQATGGNDNFLALVDARVSQSDAEVAAARRAKRVGGGADAPPAAPASSKKAARAAKAKVIRLPPEPLRLAYGRVLAVATSRKRPGGAGGPGKVPAPGALFNQPRPSVLQLVPSPSETADLWRSNVMAADADAAAARAAAQAAAAAAAEADDEEDEEKDGEKDEGEEAATPAEPPPSARRRVSPGAMVAACMARTYAGVGRAVAEELCVAAGVQPADPPDTLDDDAWAALHAAWTRWLVALAACHYRLGPGLAGRPFSVLGGGDLVAGGPLDARDPLALAAAAGAAAAGAGDPTAPLPAMARQDAFELMAAVDSYFRQVKVRSARANARTHTRGERMRPSEARRMTISKIQIKYTPTLHAFCSAERRGGRRGSPPPPSSPACRRTQ
jgi:hypothetical protein